MKDLIHAGFKSPTLSFTQDVTVDELIDVIVEHSHCYEEAAKAVEILDSTLSAGRYDGTGWHVWFVRKDQTGTIH